MGATKPSDTEETPEPHITRAKILHRPKHPLGPRLDLQALRKGIGKTPEEVARLAEMNDEELGRLEQHDDAKLSTIRRYVRALGGELELVVVLKTGHRMRIDI
jgi:predicted transcriptional regulator